MATWLILVTALLLLLYHGYNLKKTVIFIVLMAVFILLYFFFFGAGLLFSAAFNPDFTETVKLWRPPTDWAETYINSVDTIGAVFLYLPIVLAEFIVWSLHFVFYGRLFLPALFVACYISVVTYLVIIYFYSKSAHARRKAQLAIEKAEEMREAEEEMKEAERRKNNPLGLGSWYPTSNSSRRKKQKPNPLGLNSVWLE